jgi:hypothetical protein
MEHVHFFIFNLAVTAAIWYIDRKRIREYVVLSCITLFLAAIFENVTTFWGFWNYHSEPKFILISVYSWLMYVSYISYCYFFANLIMGKNTELARARGRQGRVVSKV